MVGAGGVRVGDGVDGEHGQVDGFRRQRPAGVQAGEQQHVLEQGRHPLRLGLHPGHGVQRADGHLVGGAADQLGVPADGGQRGAQLVAGVGDELAHLRLRLLAGSQCLLDVPEQLVQGGTHLSDLGGGVRVLGGHAVGEHHLAAVEGEPGDPVGGADDAVERSQLAAHEHHAGGRGDQQRERGDDHLDGDERA